jgi:hypothetical protein
MHCQTHEHSRFSLGDPQGRTALSSRSRKPQAKYCQQIKYVSSSHEHLLIIYLW